MIGGVPQVVFPGGDGWIYSFDPQTGDLIWKFDANPKDSVWELGGAGSRNNIISTPVIYKDRVYIGVGQDPEHGEAPGNFWVIDATGKGDVTDTHVVWHRGGEDFGRTISTAAIADGIVYIADLSGFLYALDAETGEHFWTYDAFAAVWGSAFVADGKVYLGDEDGDIAVLTHGKELELLDEINMGASVYTTPVAEDGVLYIASRNMLWAISEGSRPMNVDLEESYAAAKGRLDDHVREMVAWHFDPATGSPFWLDFATRLDFDPVKDVNSFDDLTLFGHFQDEWLRGGPVRRWVPKGLADQPVYVFETGGTTGAPEVPRQHRGLPHRLRDVQRQPLRRDLPAGKRLADAGPLGAAPPSAGHRAPGTASRRHLLHGRPRPALGEQAGP